MIVKFKEHRGKKKKKRHAGYRKTKKVKTFEQFEKMFSSGRVPNAIVMDLEALEYGLDSPFDGGVE